ncbi:NAD-dependent epimerase/dehydratase family protein [Paenibacillus piri]|uniref:NAD(P)-dependent oxidoreductase n=1 Tax=Paenibacillus piri TaxID=2547395 RepID=A0A4R5KRV6_9BACL|nr:NAD(P)-dependent oxidoreductase [Paenibacillus piri]TDF98559.1 NAD(P)-dependent oxidoreductase [Paenibacillus piri]
MILVTGGAGFVGSHIVERLARRGEEVVAVDLYEPAEPVKSLWDSVGGHIAYERADITDKAALVALFARYSVDRVIHAAAITPTAVRELEEPERILQIGIIGCSLVVSAAVKHGVKRFVYLSSASIYEPVPDPMCVLKESGRLQQTGLYPLTKVAGEWLTRQMTEDSGTEAVSARIAACYGPLERNTGARTAMSMVWHAVHRARAGKPLLIGSPDYVLDFTYVSDIAEGVAELLLAPAWKHEVYNISGGRAYSLLELAEAVAGTIPGTEVVVTDKPSDDAMTTNTRSRTGSLDTSRLRNDTLFVPAYPLKSGLADYVKWLDAHEY